MEVVCAWAYPMRFDDRLRTVLDSPAEEPRDRSVRWRQLVELVARQGAAASPELLSEAIAEIRTGAVLVDDQVRISTARAVSELPLPVELISAFATDRLSVAAPVLSSARLTAIEWGEVLANAGSECRRFIQALRSEPTNAATPPPSPREPVTQHEPIPSISEVVARIERLRQSRETGPETRSAKRPESDASPTVARLFRWECDEHGEIAWVEGAPRGPLIGRSIAQSEEQGKADRQIERAFAAKIPFHDATLAFGEGTPVEGSWLISGMPAFDAATGRFAGYRGVAERRGRDAEPAPPIEDSAVSDPDSLRDLAHEIRTPLNAIIGFAEIISGQYLGPAHHPYRERAAEISTQARLLLTAVEDLDFAAKLHSRRGEENSVHLGTLLERLVPALRDLAESRGATLEASRTTRDLTAHVEPELAERLVSRLCTSVIERTTAGESLRLSVDARANHCRISIDRPIALQGLSEAELFGSTDSIRAETFALRLTCGLARIAEAELTATDTELALVFRCSPLGGKRHGVYF